MPGFAISGILRPVIILRWAKRAHPELAEDNQAALWTARLVGFVGFGVTVFYFIIIIRSF